MKKVLSLVLAAAMVMGMSVSAFAADFSKPAGSAPAQDVKFEWGHVHQVRDGVAIGESAKDVNGVIDVELELKAGDKLYFEIMETEDEVVKVCEKDESADKHSKDCVLFEMPSLGKLDVVVEYAFEQMGWKTFVTVEDFFNGVEYVANNPEVKTYVKDALIAMGHADLATFIEGIVDEDVVKFGTSLMMAKFLADVDFGCEESHGHKHGDACYEYVSGAAMYKAPKNWTLKIENSEYIEDAEVVNLTKYQAEDLGIGVKGQLFVVVTLNDEFDSYEAAEEDEVLEFFMYIWDNENNAKSEKVTVHYGFEDYTKCLIQGEKHTISKSEARKYDVFVKTGDVIEANANTNYTLDSEFKTAQEVVFEIGDGVLVTVKMWPGETYLVKGSVNSKYELALSKEYDTDIKVVTFNTTCDVREVLFQAKKDAYQVVEVVDGYLYAVDSEFVTKYEVVDGVTLAKGYIAEADANEGTYALISADIELKEVPVEEPEVEADKANPSTGASDFVGAAVAMAVVSVAAAGALALKK